MKSTVPIYEQTLPSREAQRAYGTSGRVKPRTIALAARAKPLVLRAERCVDRQWGSPAFEGTPRS